MTTYRRKQTATIEATQFTSAHGGCARGVTPGSAPDGLVYSEQGGYSYHGQRIAFGDYMVGNGVMAREEFEAQYEPVVPFTEPGRLEFAKAVANSPVTKALDAVLDAHAPRQEPAAPIVSGASLDEHVKAFGKARKAARDAAAEAPPKDEQS